MANPESILLSVKKVLGVPEDYTEFDLDIIMHINSAFGVLNQLGIGPEEGYFIDDSLDEWAEFTSEVSFKMVRSYIFLKVKMLFDPPQAGYLIDAMNNQINEWEWRISHQREWNLNPIDPMEEAS